QTWIFFAFAVAFAVKVPMFPVHTWLPDAHVEAPTAGSVILAAIALKIGGYGFLRFNLPITPDAGHEGAWLLIARSLIAVVYVGLVALVRDDMKKLVAYSSVAHMGFVTLGSFIAFTLVRDYGSVDAARLGLQGAMVQMISHGFVSGAMFSCIGVLYDRMHTRRIADYGGVANVMPWFATFSMLFFMANAGLPGTSGFVGEFMIILASFQKHPVIAVLAATTLITAAAYTLWLYRRVFFGEVANAHVAELKDINAREVLVLGVFAAGTLLFGLWPKPLTDLMEPSIAPLARRIATSKLYGFPEDDHVPRDAVRRRAGAVAARAGADWRCLRPVDRRPVHQCAPQGVDALPVGAGAGRGAGDADHRRGRAGRSAVGHVRARHRRRRHEDRHRADERPDPHLRLELPARAQPVPGRAAGAGAVRDRRHDDAGLGRQPGDGVPGPGTAGAELVRAGGRRPRQPARHRGGDEVH